MKKKIFMIIILSIFFLTGCGGSLQLKGEEKEKEKQYKNDVKEIAEKFIEEKYQIKPTIKESWAGIEGTTAEDVHLTGYAYTLMEKDKYQFVVKVNMPTKEVVGDTYQNNIIEKDCITQITNIFGQEPVSIKANFYPGLTSYSRETLEFHKEYYDGSNLNAFFPKDYEINFILYGNMKNISTNQSLQNLLKGTDGVILNFGSQKDYDKVQKASIALHSPQLEKYQDSIVNSIQKETFSGPFVYYSGYQNKKS